MYYNNNKDGAIYLFSAVGKQINLSMKVRKILCQDPVEDQEEADSAAVLAEADSAAEAVEASAAAHAADLADITIIIITAIITAVGVGAGVPDATITVAAVALADFWASLWFPSFSFCSLLL